MLSVAADGKDERGGPHLVIDRPAKHVWWGGARLDLSPTEFALLAVLADGVSQAVPKQTLVRALWGSDSPAADAYLDLYVRCLRHKLGDDERHPSIVHKDGRGIRLRLSDAQIVQRFSPTT